MPKPTDKTATQKKSTELEFFPDFNKTVKELMGKRNASEATSPVRDESGVYIYGSFTINFRELTRLKTPMFANSIRKKSLKYKIEVTKLNPDDDKDKSYEFVVTYAKAQKIYKNTESDPKKMKTIEKAIYNLIMDHATGVVKENCEMVHVLDAQKIEEIFNQEPSDCLYFTNQPEEIYHKSFGVSKSNLSHIIRNSFEHYEFFKEKGYDSAALTFGRAFHSKLLTPKIYKKSTFVLPDLDLRSAQGKVMSRKFNLENADKTVISAKDSASVDNLVGKVKKHPIASMLLAEGDHEVSFYWKNKIGTISRGRADSVITKPSPKLAKELKKNIPGYVGQGVVIDYKTSESASKDEFERSILKYLYHVQAAAYCEGLETVHGIPFIFIFVVVEKSGPQSVAWFSLDEAAVEAGENEFYYALCTHKKHVDSPNQWKGYPLKAQSVSIPGWGFNRAEKVKVLTQKLMNDLKIA